MPTRPDGPGSGRRLRLDLAYDGTEFAGWARQPGQRTVQNEVELALAQVLRLAGPPRVTCAGRTDAGVHARGQVAHVDLPADIDADTASLTRWMRGVLPADITLWCVDDAPVGFDARFSALDRRYSYRVSDRPIDPLVRRHVVAWPRPLDVERLNAATAELLGEHDFAAYCRAKPDGTTIRRLIAATWHGEGDVLRLDISADAFCHGMVRSLVGAMLPVGDGRRDIGWPGAVLRSGQRDPAAVVAPAHGLVLEEVRYPDADSLLSRQRVTRAVRER
jgi:tRNA pseudouridine38-40 synthase